MTGEISERPWGTYVLTEADSYKVKRITIAPGGGYPCSRKASRRTLGSSYRHCNGHGWRNVQKVAVNEHVHITQNAKHRLENYTDEPVVLIEVQSGSYLGEDDIIRYEDIYGRG